VKKLLSGKLGLEDATGYGYPAAIISFAALSAYWANNGYSRFSTTKCGLFIVTVDPAYSALDLTVVKTDDPNTVASGCTLYKNIH
jgi:hypothetical protein